MKKFLVAGVALFAFTPSLAFADSNASGGGIINSETVELIGTFDHGGAVGSLDNSVYFANFVGGFNANQVNFTGTLTAVAGGTFASEARINLTSPDPFSLDTFNWTNGGPGGFTTYDYDRTRSFGSSFGGSVAAGGNWRLEFFESFDDAAGTDSTSSNVFMTLEEAVPLADSNGNFTLGTLNLGDSASSNGELALPNLFDSYAFTLTSDGLFSANTEFQNVFTGNSMDTEIALFDGAGNLIAEDDDGGPGLYSAFTDLNLTAGDYTLVVAGFNSSFADGFSVTAGNAVGDYGLNVSFFSAVPEPSSAMVIGLGALGLAFGRRRRT